MSFTLGPLTSSFFLRLETEIPHWQGLLREDWNGWRSLCRERDPAVFWEGVGLLAERLLQRGEEGAALELYSRAAEALSETDLFSPLRQNFIKHRDALLGRGPLNLTRLEHLGRRLVRNATDPAMIGSFLVAGGVQNLVRSSALISLAARSGRVFWTQGLGAQRVAACLAFAAEVPAFVGSGRGIRYLLRDGEAPAPEVPLADELAGAALFLGALKLSSAFVQKTFRGAPGFSRWEGMGGGLGNAVGIYFGQRLEESFGLRPAREEADRWVDLGETWLQLSLGGRIASGLFGPGHPGISRIAGFDLRTAELLREGSAVSRPGYAEEIFPETASVGRLGFRVTEEIRELAREVGHAIGRREMFSSLLQWTRIRSQEEMETGLFRLRHIVENSDAKGIRGAYAGWIIRLTVEAATDRRRVDRLDRVLRFLYRGGELRQLEAAVQGLLRESSGLRHSSRSTLGGTFALRIAELPLSPAAKEVLRGFFSWQRTLNSGDPLRLDSVEALRAMEARFQHPANIPIVSNAIREAAESPLTQLRIFRLLQILMHQPTTYPKVQELASGSTRLIAYRDRFRQPPEGEMELGTQWNAFTYDKTLAGSLVDFYRRLPQWIDPTWAQARSEARRSRLLDIWESPRKLREEEVIQAFHALGDPMSRKIERALRREVHLAILEPSRFEALLKARGRGDLGKLIDALYVPEWRWGREWNTVGSGSPRPSILIKQLAPVYSLGPFLEAAFFRMGHVVHEFEHHRHSHPNYVRDHLGVLSQEMKSHLQECRWLAEHGDADFIARLADRAYLGWPVALRDIVERYYLGSSHVLESAREMSAMSPEGGAGEDIARYRTQLLRLARQEIEGALRGSEEPSDVRNRVVAWLDEVRDTENAHYSLPLHRLERQMRRIAEQMEERHWPRRMAEFRRRLDWVDLQFGRSEASPLDPLGELTRQGYPPGENRRDLGRRLLLLLHSRISTLDLRLFEEAASGPVRNRDIAFDLDRTLGDTFLRHLAGDALKQNAVRFDVAELDDFVHQFTRIRLPYRGMQALLLGLWAAGNRLRLYTASENLPENHEAFFNDFPLLKVAFNLAPPEQAFQLLTPEALHRNPHFMDALKREEFHRRYFGSPEGEDLVRRIREAEGLSGIPYLETSKIPFPDFPMDVLVDDLWYYAGELQSLGFGRRWIRSPENAPELWKALLEYFARPVPQASELLKEWLRAGT